ncbi:alpha/beta fold hydrolase [Gordonibacter sp.]|uniref:alpha/beta fold hydrolase n=1 Tax=Gordonibacter sp. TaxID=1968902 RepID=UPI002FCC3319
MKTIYKSPEAKHAILELYDKQLARLDCAWEDRFVDTSFGTTHLIVAGNPQGIPLLVFHGGNATTAYNLLACLYLLEDFCVYAVDTIGHPGKSAETCLSPSNYDYGVWAAEVIGALGFESMRCFAGSFGAGIVAKLMCAAPQRVERAVLCVPSGIKNAAAWHSMSMMAPMIAYWLTRKESWFVKTILPMSITEEAIDTDTLETARASIDGSKIKVGMPSDVDPERMGKCQAETLVMAAERDCLFPASGVIPQAERIIPHCTTYLLRDRGHIHRLTEDEKSMILEFLKK